MPKHSSNVWVNDEYMEVLSQMFVIALPSNDRNGQPACPWLAGGFRDNKVSLESGLDPLDDVTNAVNTLGDKWASIYWYPKNTNVDILRLTCKVMTSKDISVIALHKEVAPNLNLAGEYPVIIVENTKLLKETFRED